MTRTEHSSRPRRESLRKRLGVRRMRLIDARDAGCCIYCGDTKETSGAHMHLDHIIPKNLGGNDDLTNLVIACRSCNSSRKDMTMVQWEAYAAAHMALTFDAAAVVAHAERIAA